MIIGINWFREFKNKFENDYLDENWDRKNIEGLLDTY
jgi:hypothetical protein